MKREQAYVGGRWAGAKNNTLDVIDPAARADRLPAWHQGCPATAKRSPA